MELKLLLGVIQIMVLPTLITLSVSASHSHPSHQLDALLDDHYDGEIPVLEGQPVEVRVNLTLHGMGIIYDDDQEITLQMDIWETWLDPRLNRIGNETLPNTIVIADDSKIWVPDLYFEKAKEPEILKTISKISVDGQITKLTKLHITAHCPMTFFYFPFDNQVCTFHMTSLEHSTRELLYKWSNENGTEAVKIGKEISETNLFRLKGYNFVVLTSQGILGDHPSLEMKLFIQRKGERNFPIFYFPAIALIMLAFKSLYLKNKLHGIYMSLSAFLTFIVFVTLMQNEITRSSEMSMLDHYYFLCLNLILNVVTVNIIMHLFLQPGRSMVSTDSHSQSSIETASIDQKLELKNLNGNQSNVSNSSVHSRPGTPDQADPEEHIRKMSKFKQFIYFKSCKPAKYQLPIVFLVINVIYWIWILIAFLKFPSGFQSV